MFPCREALSNVEREASLVLAGGLSLFEEEVGTWDFSAAVIADPIT